jgi:hypothetical protein
MKESIYPPPSAFAKKPKSEENEQTSAAAITPIIAIKVAKVGALSRWHGNCTDGN